MFRQTWNFAPPDCGQKRLAKEYAPVNVGLTRGPTLSGLEPLSLKSFDVCGLLGRFEHGIPQNCLRKRLQVRSGTSTSAQRLERACAVHHRRKMSIGPTKVEQFVNAVGSNALDEHDDGAAL